MPPHPSPKSRSPRSRGCPYDVWMLVRRSRLVLFIAAPFFAWLALIAWALASPVASSPDDDFHLAAIWCAGGDQPGRCEPVDDSPTARLVPSSIVTATCYAFRPDQDASCWDSGAQGMTRVERANIDHLYPGVYYRVMNFFVSDDVQLSVLTMRFFNVSLVVGLLTSLAWALPRSLRTPLIVSLAVTAVPLGMFLFASTNPSGWAILSAAMVWVSVYATGVTQGRRSLALAAFAVLGAVIGAGARADAAVFAVFGAVLAVFLSWPVATARSRRNLLGAAVSVAAVSVALYFSAKQGGSALGGLEPTSARLSAGQHLSNLLEVPALWTGALGQAGLGWLDTRMPASVWVLTTAVFAGAIFVGLRRSGTRRAVAVGVALAATWVVPLVMLAQSNALVGQTVQPRYLLPLMVIAVGIASLRKDAEQAWSGSRLTLAASALSIAVTIALHQNMRRYTAGASNEAIDPGAGAHWWWVGTPSPLIGWLVGSLAFVGLIASLSMIKRSTKTEQTALKMPTPSSQQDLPRG